jgi:hypothetical protein
MINTYNRKKGIKTMQVYISNSKYNCPDKNERIQAVIDYVNILFDGLYELEEINEQTLEVYYVDYYYTQITNVGHLQFFLNSHEDENLLPLIFNGLKRMGAHEYVQLLTSACDALAIEDEALLVETVAQIDDQFDEYGERLFELNYNYVSRIQDLVIVPEELLYKMMQNLLDCVPDYEERVAQAQEEADSNEHVQLAIGVCSQFNIDFSQLNGLDAGEELLNDAAVDYNLQNDIYYLHLDTSAGYHYIINEKTKATLVNGQTGHIVGAVAL